MELNRGMQLANKDLDRAISALIAMRPNDPQFKLLLDRVVGAAIVYGIRLQQERDGDSSGAAGEGCEVKSTQERREGDATRGDLHREALFAPAACRTTLPAGEQLAERVAQAYHGIGAVGRDGKVTPLVRLGLASAAACAINKLGYFVARVLGRKRFRPRGGMHDPDGSRDSRDARAGLARITQ